jgi:NADPH2:quinone reductase
MKVTSQVSHAVILREPGGPDKLQWESVSVARPGVDEIRICHTAIGVNFHDTYVRSGLYRTLALPGVIGLEAAGIVEEVGLNVTAFAPGDRVCYVDPAYGAYSQIRNLPARIAIRLPDTITDEAAASMTVKGLTVGMLLRRVRLLRSADTLLIHAAAGGVGQALVRMAKHLGATVIATVGSSEKAAVALGCGADHVILYRTENFVNRVAEITGGVGVNAVYDSVGADTFLGSIACLGYFGTLVNFGQSSGPVPPFPVSLLADRSTSVVRPILFHYIRERATLQAMADDTFKALEMEILKAQIGLRLPLARAAEAHKALESRATTGAIVLEP